MDHCRFCQIVAGEHDAHVIHADERTVAFLDANPAREGHVLVVPTQHAEDLLLLDSETLTAVWRTARRVARALESVLDPDGFSAFHTTGGLVGTVEHAHLHLVPRDVDDDIHLALDRDALADDSAAQLAERMRDALGARD